MNQEPSLAEKLRIARTQAGLSQQQVADRLGLKRPAVSEIEAGRRGVKADELDKLAKMYDVKVEWLLSTSPSGLSPKVEIAARQLARLNPAELDKLLSLLDSLRDTGES